MVENLPKALAFDVDPATLVCLGQAFPRWRLLEVSGATTRSLACDWDPSPADLLVVGARAEAAEALGLCRALRSQFGETRPVLLVLVGPSQHALVPAALKLGADSCLVLPVHPKELITMVDRALAGNRPGRHTLGLDQPQCEDVWRDGGGEA